MKAEHDVPNSGPISPANIHATCVAIGEAGVLIQGAAGAGKSRLARRLIDESRRAGLFARLVADDRTAIAPRADRLVARPHPAIAGRMEARGLGIGQAPHEEAVIVRLAVDLDPAAPRMPTEIAGEVSIAGVRLPRICIRPGEWDLVMIALGHGVIRR